MMRLTKKSIIGNSQDNYAQLSESCSTERSCSPTDEENTPSSPMPTPELSAARRHTPLSGRRGLLQKCKSLTIVAPFGRKKMSKDVSASERESSISETVEDHSENSVAQEDSRGDLSSYAPPRCRSPNTTLPGRPSRAMPGKQRSARQVAPSSGMGFVNTVAPEERSPVSKKNPKRRVKASNTPSASSPSDDVPPVRKQGSSQVVSATRQSISTSTTNNDTAEKHSSPCWHLESPPGPPQSPRRLAGKSLSLRHLHESPRKNFISLSDAILEYEKASASSSTLGEDFNHDDESNVDGVSSNKKATKKVVKSLAGLPSVLGILDFEDDGEEDLIKSSHANPKGNVLLESPRSSITSPSSHMISPRMIGRDISSDDPASPIVRHSSPRKAMFKQCSARYLATRKGSHSLAESPHPREPSSKRSLSDHLPLARSLKGVHNMLEDAIDEYDNLSFVAANVEE